MTDKVYRVAAIGCGRKGTEHARAYNLNRRSVVVAGADPDAENLDIFTERFGVPGYADYNEMLRKEKVDIVLAVLPVIANREVVLDSGDVTTCPPSARKSPLPRGSPMLTRLSPPAVSVASSSAAATSNATTITTGRRRTGSQRGRSALCEASAFYQGSGTQLSGGGCQIFGLARLFADDAEVDWITGWVSTDPWSEYDQGGAGYIRFVNGVEAFLHRSDTGRYGFEVLGERGTVHER